MDTPPSNSETPRIPISTIETQRARTPSVTTETKAGTQVSQAPSATSNNNITVSAPAPTFDPSSVSTEMPGTMVILAGDSANLIAAIVAANDDEGFPDLDTIYLDGGIYSIYHPFPMESEDGPSAFPSIRTDLTIIGNGATIERHPDVIGEFRIFHISEVGNLELRDLTIRNGSTTGIQGGGGIFNRGILKLQDCTLTGNDNTALSNFKGTMKVENCTIHRNMGILGGGIFNLSPHFLEGEGIMINNSTISENQAGAGGGIYNFIGTVSLVNTIVADNTHNYIGGDCAGNPVTSNGHNLDSDGSCDLSADGDVQNTDPLLGPLSNEENRTSVQALLPESPAIDAGDDKTCALTDQHGAPRPSGPHCDIGAIEFNSTVP